MNARLLLIGLALCATMVQAQTVAIRAGRLVDPEAGTALANQVILVENGRVTGEEHLLADRGQRIRDVRQGPDGALYVVTDDDNGQLLRIAPRG